MNRLNPNLDAIKTEALAELASAGDPEDIKTLSIKYLGRKGIVTLFLRNITSLPLEERPAAGKAANLTAIPITNSKEHEFVTPAGGRVVRQTGTISFFTFRKCQEQEY